MTLTMCLIDHDLLQLQLSLAIVPRAPSIPRSVVLAFDFRFPLLIFAVEFSCALVFLFSTPPSTVLRTDPI